MGILWLMYVFIFAGGFYVLARQYAAVGKAATYAIDSALWDGSQLQRELLRLETLLQSARVSDSMSPAAAIARQLDLAWNGLNRFLHGVGKSRIQAYPDAVVTVAKIKTILEHLDALLQQSQGETATFISLALPRVSEAHLAINQVMQRLYVSQNERLSLLHETLASFQRSMRGYAMGLALLIALLMFVTWRRMQSARMLQEARDALEVRVQERTAALVRANAQLQAEITERTRAEQTLQESEAHYRAVVEGSIQGMSITTQRGVRVFANTALAKMFGYTGPEDFVGRTVWTDIAPHERARIRGYAAARFRGEPAPTRYEYQGVRQDGTPIWIERMVSPVVWEGETALLSTYMDVTERKRTETQLRQTQKMEAIGTLAGGIAHDFNNILSAMLGYTELALYDLAADNVASRYLKEVLIAGKRARDLVQQILTFSRRTEQERKPIQLDLIIKEALTLLRASLPSTIEIRQQVTKNAGLVLADPTQMHQVLMNLCTNAEHAMRATSGVLEVHLEPVEVTPDLAAVLSGLTVGPYLRLTVQDTGHGIAPEVLEHIFEPFFTTKGVGEGTGMGLAVVHGIITSHGGTVTVESTPGLGSRFDVYLPRIAAIARPQAGPEEGGLKAPSAHAVAEEAVAHGKGRVLLVDDEAALVHVSQGMLTYLGYEVVTYTNSMEALAAFKAAPYSFDLILTDHTMPHLTGEALARELRSIRPDLPIILCTGFSHTMNEAKAHALGIDALLMKPFLTRDLGTAIQQVLAQRSTP
jgi:PAS domain S-box-containing protein